MKQVYTPSQDYKVLVHTITYNQAKYITDTLDGVAMQRTNFPFVHYVIDDCSTDGEQDVIKGWLEHECDMHKAEYADLELANVILVPHKTNTFCTFAIYLLKRNLWKEQELKETLVDPWREHCEYEALCEGDDYWIDSFKLQKQVDWMEAHFDCGMCYTKARIWLEDEETYSNDIQGEVTDFQKLLLGYNTIPTASVIYRRDAYKQYLKAVKPKEKKWKLGDYPMALFWSFQDSIHSIDDLTAVYRIVCNSASHTTNEKRLLPYYYSILNIKLFFIQFCKIKDKWVIDGVFNQHYSLLSSKFNCARYCFTLSGLSHIHSLLIWFRYMITLSRFIIRKQMRNKI